MNKAINTVIYSRRSIRKFKDAAIPMEAVERILQAGIAAPSAKNRQPWRCIVLAGSPKEAFLSCMERGIEREQTANPDLPRSRHGLPDAQNTLRVMRSAPVLIAVLNTNGKSPFTALDPDERFTEICDSLSIGAMIQNMLLQSQELGIGSLWIANTCFAYRELVGFLQTGHQLVGAVALGYGDENPPARPRKSLRHVVEYRL